MSVLDKSEKPQDVSLFEAMKWWLKLGFISFGGPAGQISMMHQELVERRRWISESRFSTCSKLHHGIARTRGAAVSDLYGLVVARSKRRVDCRWFVCIAIFYLFLSHSLGYI